MKILIADDDPLSRHLVQKTLQRAGYEVVAVHDGIAAARQLCTPDGPRLALLDWEMPLLDGPGVCREVRKNKQDYVYMILLTSKESKSDIVAGLESGADDYLVKPFDARELKARLRTGQRILHLEGRLVEARDEMLFKATHDSLTALFNRGVMLDLLGREISRSQRGDAQTAILLCDIDHFKRINDTYGHAVGDEVLQESAKRFLLSVRSYDYVGRYGGEEFLIILNNCDAAASSFRGEEIRRALADNAIQTSSGPVGVTLSIGMLQTGEWADRPAKELLREVDCALYAAKAAGRNCIRYASPKLAGELQTVSV